jgi:hypothetical protein
LRFCDHFAFSCPSVLDNITITPYYPSQLYDEILVVAVGILRKIVEEAAVGQAVPWLHGSGIARKFQGVFCR